MIPDDSEDDSTSTLAAPSLFLPRFASTSTQGTIYSLTTTRSIQRRLKHVVYFTIRHHQFIDMPINTTFASIKTSINPSDEYVLTV